MDRLGAEESIPLDVPFKGTRDYLTGADLFDALLDVTGAKGSVVLVMRRLMQTPVSTVPIPPSVDPSTYPAEFHYTSAGSDCTVVLREDPSRKVTRRIPYDEERVTAPAVISGTCLSCPLSETYSFIEQVVALNKLLLNRSAVGADSPKWLFTRIELDTVPETPQVLDLKLVATIGSRITKTAIRTDGGLVGHIYFSRASR
jgi:hypothetical protein